jgi:predicted aspartyl protease
VKRVALVVGVVLAMASPAMGALFRWVDAAGVTYYTSDRANIPEQYRDSAKELEHPSARQPQPAASPVSSTTTPSSGAVVPLPTGSPIMVEAALNGVPLRLVLDTGADRTVISPAALTRAGIDATVGTPFRISGVTGASSSASLVNVPRLDVAGAQVGPLGVVAFTVPGEFDGLLGRDVLDAFTVTFDPGRNRATLTPR